jgi:DNA-binding transcriptional ArsR family regulator
MIRRGGGPVRECASAHDLFRVLQSENPLDVLRCLAEGDADVGTLADRIEIDHSAASHSLGKLYRRGLVTASRDCKRHVYRLTSSVEATVSPDVIHFRIALGRGGAVQFTAPRMPDARPAAPSAGYSTRCARG